MANIKIIGRLKNKKIYFCNYTKELDKAIENFKGARTVKVLKGVCYIHFVSLGYFTEILQRERINFSIITTLN